MTMRTDRAAVRLRRWDSVSEREYGQITAIWREAFPPQERFAEDSVGSRASTWLWVATAPDAGVVGFATALRLARSGAAYLEYLAIERSWRGSGVGSAVLAAMARDLAPDHAVTGVVLEVEDPARTPGGDPALTRRLDFYARWDATPLARLRDYRMPDLTAKGATLPMLLLWRRMRGPEPGARGLRALLEDLYLDYYAGMADDGHLAAMLAGIVPAAGVDSYRTP